MNHTRQRAELDLFLRLLHIPVEVLNGLEYPDQGQALLGCQFETFCQT
jgi:hypothetical protein